MKRLEIVEKEAYEEYYSSPTMCRFIVILAVGHFGAHADTLCLYLRLRLNMQDELCDFGKSQEEAPSETPDATSSTIEGAFSDLVKMASYDPS